MTEDHNEFVAETVEPTPPVDDAPAENADNAETQAPEPVADNASEPVADETPEPVADDAAEPVPDASPEPAAEADETVTPKPHPVPRPGPAGGEHAPVPTPAGAAPSPAAVAEEPVAVLHSAPTDPTQWGHVAEDGTVVLHAPDGERAVGSYPGKTAEEALAYFGRKFDELVAQVDLAEQRLQSAEPPVKDVARQLSTVKHALPEANVVGDIAGLVTRITELEASLDERKAAADQARQQARDEAYARRLVLVEEAETIAATDAARMQWRQSGDRMKHLFDEWKAAQSSGPRLEKPREDELWKRFSHSRNSFDRMRRQYFSKLHSEQDKVKSAKEKIVAEAEALSSSTDWGATAGAYRDLMSRWKAAGRANRKDDDALWARFRAAQDVFFNARSADQAAQDEEFAENLRRKEELLDEAEKKILPVKDLKAAKAALRSVHDRWDQIGKVPRSAMQRVERRMRAVEQAVKEVEDEKWRRSNPETKARAEGALEQLDRSIEGLEQELADAQASGDKRKIRDAEEALKTKKAWRDQIAQLGR